MHQVQIINQHCAGNPAPINVQVIRADHRGHPQLIRDVQVPIDQSTTVLLPEGSSLIIREQAHA